MIVFSRCDHTFHVGSLSYNKEEYLRLTACIGELSRLEDKKNGWRAEIIHAEKALSACGILEFKKKSELREQIAALQERIEISEEQSSSTVSRYGFSDMSYQELFRKQKELAFVDTLLHQEDAEKKRCSENITAFRRESVNLSADEKAAMESRDMVRQEYDRSIEDTVKKQDKDYDANTLKQAASDTDRKLGLDREVRVQSKTKHLSL